MYSTVQRRNLGGYYKKRLTVSQNVRGALGILVKCVNEWLVACLFLVGFSQEQGEDSEGGVLCSKITCYSVEHQVKISGTKLNFCVRLTMM